MTKISLTASSLLISTLIFISCNNSDKPMTTNNSQSKVFQNDTAEYFLLYPQLERTYGYSQAVKIGDIIKISGAVSIDSAGRPIGKGDFLQQMKTCYAALDKVLKHYGCTFEDVVVENLYTTSMDELHKHVAYRNEIYKEHYPTGTWIGVKELGLPEFMIEIEIEACISKK